MAETEFIHRACPACGADAPKPEVASEPAAETMSLDALRPYWSGLFKEKVFFSYDRCGRCGLLFTPTFFTGPQLGELYSSMAPNMDVVPKSAHEATQRGYYETAIAGADVRGGFLEIGPDIGYIVKLAAASGRFDDFWLFEPNRAVHAELAAATGGTKHCISTDMDDLSAVPDGSIALAVMVHVLDHVLDPMATLAAVRAKLKPGGRLMIVTHNEASVLRKVMGVRWPPFCLQHPELYNPKSMTNMIERAGYASVKVERSRNHFPLDFLARQAAFTVGLKLDKVPLPKIALGLKLGNMITVAER